MRVLFVISATLWTWLVGRCLAYGPQKTIFTLKTFQVDSWYCLTPLQLKIPVNWVRVTPIAMAVLTVPTLFIDDNLTHCSAVLLLVSEHFYFPMFEVHIHSFLCQWSVFHVLVNVAIAWWFHSLYSVAHLLKGILHAWYFIIELQLGHHIVREPPPYTSRQPRTV